MADTTTQSRVKKRASNACTRCRRQKIRCSGHAPCEQCTKRDLSCAFDSGQQKVLVSREFIARLERQAGRTSQGGSAEATFHPGEDGGAERTWHVSSPPGGTETSPVLRSGDGGEPQTIRRERSPAESNTDETDHQPSPGAGERYQDAVPAAAGPGLVNPLAPGVSPAYTADPRGKPFYLGTTSNWSFGRRVLSMVHEKVHGSPLPMDSLLFEGATYDLGWDGRRDILSNSQPQPSLPTPDHAIFLINAVKFQCGQLFHLFDEPTFMDQFRKFHESDNDPAKCSVLWYVHYLLILAFGKAFMVRTPCQSRQLFMHAMKMLPDITFLCANPIESIEVLCCAALYLQCLDSRSAAYNLIGQAMRIAIEQGMHTNMESQYLAEHVVERSREVWWTVYVLDRLMSSLLGAPLALADEDITARLPSYPGSAQKSLALSMQIKTSGAFAAIQRTIYRKDGPQNKQFLGRVKEAIKIVASANDHRNNASLLDLQKPGQGISRLSAYLHIFHHQCIILATRPLLYHFWQMRISSTSPLRVISRGGARSLLRVCVGSAKQTIEILGELLAQGLLESFLPFDLDAAFSSAVVLSLAGTVDPSLFRDVDRSWLQAVYVLLEEMVSRGNQIARFVTSELHQLDEAIKLLPSTSSSATAAQQSTAKQGPPPSQPDVGITHEANNSMGANGQTSITPDFFSEWNSDDGLSGDQLMALANSLDFEHLDWLDTDLLQAFNPQVPP